MDFLFGPMEPLPEPRRRPVVARSIGSSVEARDAGVLAPAEPTAALSTCAPESTRRDAAVEGGNEEEACALVAAPEPARVAAARAAERAAADSDDDEIQCRVCFCGESDGDGPDDELIVPCRCAGTMLYVHRSCLDSCRVGGFDPSALTRCSLCKTDYVIEDATRSGDSRLGPRGELALVVGRFVTVRVAAFVAAAAILGFAPRLVVGRRAADRLPRLSARPLVNHLGVGSLSALCASGLYAATTLVGPVNLVNQLAFRRRYRARKEDSIEAALALLVVVGACYLLYHLATSVYYLARTGIPLAVDNLRSANRDVRRRICEKYRVVDRRSRG